jgi:hypothetical protein
MPEPRPEFMFRFELDLAPAIEIGDVPIGHRIIGPIAGGSFEGPGLSDGPALKGEVVPGGGDWLFARADGVLDLDVRTTLRTDDGALIYMPYTGLLVIPEGKAPQVMTGEVPPDYMTVSIRFETAAEKYSALNQLIAVGTGSVGPAKVYYDVFAIR